MPEVQLTGVRAVAFDLDDTLYPEESFVFSGFDAVAAWLRERIACPSDPSIRMRELYRTSDRRRVFDVLLGELGCTEPADWVSAMIACYREHAPVLRLFDDAERCLGSWCSKYRLGLISDGPEAVQRRKFDALGLAGRLSPVILTDVWGPEYWKPHPRAFREFERASGASGPACLYIADNPVKDFAAPRHLGWRTIRVARAGGVYFHQIARPGEEPEFQVSDLDQICLA